MREIKIINGGWYFSNTASSAPSAIPTDWQTLDLPHTWNGADGQDGGNDYIRTKAYYCKEISAADLTGEANYLEFDAVNSSAEVFWNGKSLFTHHGGYSRFRVKIPADNIKETNLLVVSADNSPNEEVYPQVADFTFYGGIYRSVKLVSVPSSHFDLDYFGAPGIAATPVVNGADADVTIESFVTNPNGLSVQYKILADGEAVELAEVTADADSSDTESESASDSRIEFEIPKDEEACEDDFA